MTTTTPNTDPSNMPYRKTDTYAGDVRRSLTGRLLYSEVGTTVRGTSPEFRHFFTSTSDDNTTVIVRDSLANAMSSPIVTGKQRS